MAKKTWGIPSLLTGWAGYWAVLAATTLAKPLWLISRISDQPPNTSGASFNVGGSGLAASIQSYGQDIWSLHASFFSRLRFGSRVRQCGSWPGGFGEIQLFGNMRERSGVQSSVRRSRRCSRATKWAPVLVANATSALLAK